MKNFLVLLILVSFNVGAKDLTLNDIYEKFNMRTIYSSYGQRLKHYCESYPKDYFSKEKTKFIDGKQLELVSGDDVWVFTLNGSNSFFLNNQIISGTYNSGTEYFVQYNKINNDWRAGEILIKKKESCVNYVEK